MNAFLTKVYYDPSHPAGFGTATKLFNTAVQAGKEYSKESIRNWLLEQDTFTLFRPQRKRFPRRKTISYGLFDVHQADLADMTRYASANDGIMFLLVVIDVLSKRAWVEPLRDKRNESMVQAFKKIYGEGSTAPYSLGTDAGTEFTGKAVQDLLKKKYGINHYVLGSSSQKAAVAERLIRTLKTRIRKWMDSQGSQVYANHLQDFVDAYNATVHRSIKMKPKDVTFLNAGKVFKTLYGDVVRRKNHPLRRLPRFAVGDRVRITKYKQAFDKGYEQNYTDEIFTVTRVVKSIPYTYKLKDTYHEPIIGSFYEPELTLTIVKPNKAYRVEYVLREKGKGKRKKILVKFRGYSKPEWTNHMPASVSKRQKK